MKFNLVYLIYSSILAFVVGVTSAVFLEIVSFLINFIWVLIPAQVQLGKFYPLVIGLIGGGLVFLVQKHWGDYPKTLHEMTMELKTKHRVEYQNGSIFKNFFSALVVLGFGASLGPEAALSSILGGMITWIGDRLKLARNQKDELINLGIGAMMAAVFRAPLVVFGETEELVTSKTKRYLLNGFSTAIGFLGFILTKKMFPEASIFAIRIPKISWDFRVLYLIIPALLLGILFAIFFLASEKLFNNIAAKIKSTLLKSVIAGLAMGVLGTTSYLYLFSGESNLLPLSETFLHYSWIFLVILALGKSLLTNLMFAFGWRGGKIFPAIFASAAIGFAVVANFNFVPGLIIAIIVSSSVAIILDQPAIVSGLLVFLFPLQFFPAILGASFLGNLIFKKVQKLIHD